MVVHSMLKPYRNIPICECGQPLVPIPPADFDLTTPHAYVAAGAPYGTHSPWQLRTGVLTALQQAQFYLHHQQPTWRLRLFDAYRPNAVQAYMVAREFRLLSNGREPYAVPEPERAALWQQTFRLWAMPSDDPAMPPPHSTGAAVDLTLVMPNGEEAWLGSPIDENSDRSMPDYFIDKDSAAHHNRLLLRAAMQQAGFAAHLQEWWHFSLGDQYWAWRQRETGADTNAVAYYGRATL
jgi:zinc D-Ala-D-Ala dipeptidase